MRVIEARDVNEAYAKGMHLLNEVGVQEQSRAGPVLVAPFPVVTIYDNPLRRVLFDPGRDANPFFHLFEALWMLAGWDDAKWLDSYVGDFSKRFAEEDGTVHGAYGKRWRWVEGHDVPIDQLKAVIHKLKTNPRDRQAVIQMWDAGLNNDLLGNWKDRPCNTHIYLRIREAVQGDAGASELSPVLDLTVCCRSNDIIWGAYGSNAVHFSILQEYLAAMIGVGVGKMYQVSNNFHAYLDVFEKSGLPTHDDIYENNVIGTMLIVTRPEAFDFDLAKWMKEPWNEENLTWYENIWFRTVAVPMARAYRAHRNKDKEAALGHLGQVAANDWQVACTEWILRRKAASASG